MTERFIPYKNPGIKSTRSPLEISKSFEYLRHINELNSILKQSAPKILVPKIEVGENESIAKGLIYNIFKKDVNIWQPPKSKERIYHVYAPELQHIPRGNSAHNLFFTEARVADRVTTIAVKPFISKPEKALNEFINTYLVNEEGIQTFTPLACFLGRENGFYLSQVKHGIMGLDQLRWPNYFRETDGKSLRYTSDILEKIAVKVARMHTSGIFHGDAGIKNFVIPHNGNIMPIDWESSNIYKYITREKFLKNAKEDLTSLLKSLYKTPENFGAGIFHIPEPQNNIWPHFNETIVSPYINALLNKSQTPTLLFNTSEAIDDLKKGIKEISKSKNTYISDKKKS